MAESLADLLAQREALSRQIRSGEQEVFYQGMRVVYRPIADLIKAREQLDRDIEALVAAGTVESPVPRQIRMVTSDGYDGGSE